jgi:drug/metabolite transporter (DMT)-like permease
LIFGITKYLFYYDRLTVIVAARVARSATMGEILGVLAAVTSSALGGTSIGATRFLVSVLDPLAIGSLRFGLGFVFLLPAAFLKREPWPKRPDLIGVIGLGVLFFFLFPLLFNASLIFTTAARGALALSTLPLMTMLIGAALRSEPLTGRKTSGVVVAMIGVALALLPGLNTAPVGAWRGDLLMVAAALCMAFYSVWSKPFIRRSGAITFTVLAMAAGAACLVLTSLWHGSFAPVAFLRAPQWFAILYLGVFGSAFSFFLWSLALGNTTPTRVAISIAVNPISASIVGAALLDEPLRWNLLLGIATVFTGIWIATTQRLKGFNPTKVPKPPRPRRRQLDRRS